MVTVAIWLAALAVVDEPLAPGNHVRTVEFEGKSRPYLLHVPAGYDGAAHTPVIVALHGFAMPAALMPPFTGLDAASDKVGFLVVYPSGTGIPVRWNSGGFRGQSGDDVGYIRTVIDDLASVANVDPARVYATGISNGAMMCYRLAAELSDRIAAIAPVAGTMAQPSANPLRPVPVIHFHGTADSLVPFGGPSAGSPAWMTFKSVDDSIKAWAVLDGCPDSPRTTLLPDTDQSDGCTVERTVYGPGREGAEVVLYTVRGGGHTWPGRKMIGRFLGATTLDIDADTLIWEFFVRHPKQLEMTE
jgi:polyhydroxybutyrate depolymerase